MADPRWLDVRRILEQALDLKGDARARFLDEACAGDADLRREVESLLAAGAVRPGWLDESLAGLERDVTHRFGKYSLIRELGRGGMGAIVWLARDDVFGREVALKVIAEGVMTSPEELERFHRESKSAGKLTHSGIVQVYEEGRTEHACYFAMEYIAGHDLAREIQLQSQAGPTEACVLPPFASSRYVPAVVRLCAEVADALAYAHGEGVLHRDIKPRNLLLDREGKAYLADFGLARDDRFGSISQSSAILGTPYYMSPEQARLLAAGSVDHRTDVYSLGVVLYELLTLQRPFEGKTGDEIRSRIQHEDARPVQRMNRRVPADLATICHGAIAKNRTDRYETAAAFAVDLRRFLAHESIFYRPPPIWRRVTQRARRHRVRLSVVAFVALVATATWAIAARRALAEEREAQLHAVRALLSEPDWIKLPTERLVADRSLVWQLRGAAATANDSDVDRAKKRFDQLRTEMLTEADKLQDAGRADLIDPGAPYVTEAKLMEGVFLLQRTAIVFGDPSLLKPLGPNPFAPRLSVTARDEHGERFGRVGYREIDGVTGVPGPLIDLGPLPLRGAPAVAGYLRIVVRVDGVGEREFSRLLWRGTWKNAIEVDARRPLDDTDMVPIAGATLRLRDQGTPYSGLNNKEVVIEPFSIDRYEVSIGQYRAFLAAQPGRRKPLGWNTVRTDQDDLPVAYVGWEDARAYAEWAGKRLPTHGEWVLAARGPGGALFPWPEPQPGVYRGNTDKPWLAPRSLMLRVPLWLERAVPVRSYPDAATAAGVFHLLGNVAEWSESLGTDLAGTTVVPRPFNRIVLGSAWFAAAEQETLTSVETVGADPSYWRYFIGFRCARSRQSP